MHQDPPGDPERLEFRRDGGICGAIGCGLPLAFCAGGTLAWGFPDTPASVARLIAAGFGLGALLFAFGRWRIVLDGGRRELVEWKGLLVPMTRRVRACSEFERVTLTCSTETPTTVEQAAVVASGHAFPIRIEGRAGSVELEMLGGYAEARRRAEQVSRLAGLPLVDSCRAGPITVPPEGAAVASETPGAPPAWAVPAHPGPPPDRLVIEETPGGLAVFVPPSGFTWRFWVITPVASVLPATLLAAAVVVGSDPGLASRVGAVVLCLVPGLLMLAYVVVNAVRAATRRERVEAAPGMLRIRWQDALRWGSVEVDAADILELLVLPASSEALRLFRPTGHVVCLRLARDHQELGAGLTADQLAWLRAALAWRLAPAIPSEH